MTDKVRVRFGNHVIVEPVRGGVILHVCDGQTNNQEDVCTHLYTKNIFTDEAAFVKYIKGMVFSEGCFDD